MALSNPPDGVSAELVTFTGDTVSLPLLVAPGCHCGMCGQPDAGIRCIQWQQPCQCSRAVKRAGPAGARAAKIADALAAEHHRSRYPLLYRLYALAGDPRLPDEMVGSGGDEEDLVLFNADQSLAAANVGGDAGGGASVHGVP